MEYYSVRNGLKIILDKELYERFSSMMEDFSSRDYFKEKLKLENNSLETNYINIKSKSHIGIAVYPFASWKEEDQLLNLIFDAIEFLFRFVSKPKERGFVSDVTGYNTYDYLSYDEIQGKADFLEEVNILLKAYGQGYELKSDGMILFVGDESVNFLNTEDLPKYNKANIDFDIHLAIKWWKNRNQSLEDKKQAIFKLVGVLEYLKEDGTLSKILGKKDSSDLFNIANNFGIRHNNPDQKSDFDKGIWYDWIFQYYLNTCIGVLRLIKKNEFN